MTTKKDFLFELLTEELPPKSLQTLSNALLTNIKQLLDENKLHYKGCCGTNYPELLATPRRLAVRFFQLDEKQPDQEIERQGPMINLAFDKAGKPTPACVGFAKSCGTIPDKLKTTETDKGERLSFRKKEKGKTVFELLPKIIEASIKKLPIAKTMRWGNHEFEFVRPVHNILMIYGEKIIPAKLFGITTTNETFGHRFLAPKKIKIKALSEYEKLLEDNYVLVDFYKRKKEIEKQINAHAKQKNGNPVYDDALLNEVTALVEWPVALTGSFSRSFLKVPKEALISSIQSHQYCFPLENKDGNLLPYFIAISNIKSKKPQEVIKGNERVIQARLSDAEFFYREDLKRSLESRIESLKKVIYQARLGTLYDKTKRLEQLTTIIAKMLGYDDEIIKKAARAAQLAKTDLLTNMVYEFPEMQGIAGYYYASHDNEPKEVALALKNQYSLEFLNEDAPRPISQILALADRVDTLVGFFGINKLPTSNKDPMGLRRAAIGAINILNDIPINLLELFKKAKNIYQVTLPNKNLVDQLSQFITERLKHQVIADGFTANQFTAVQAVCGVENIADFFARTNAVHDFYQGQPDNAKALAAANKRVANILSKENISTEKFVVDKNLLQEKAEIKLAEEIEKAIQQSEEIFNDERLPQYRKYLDALKTLAKLRKPVDQLFDETMIMVDNKKIRNNRLALLIKLRKLFLQIADISFL
jgi:glycyl-tRNA synthetase beta chain